MSIKAKLVSAVKRAPRALTPETLFQSAGITEAEGRDALSQLVSLGEIVVGRGWLLYAPTSTEPSAEELGELLDACRQFIYDAFDKHGLDLHEDDCSGDVDDGCDCPRVAEANRLLRGWVAR